MTQPDPQGARALGLLAKRFVVTLESYDDLYGQLIDVLDEAIAANNAALAERVRGLERYEALSPMVYAVKPLGSAVSFAAVLDLLVPTVTTDHLPPDGDKWGHPDLGLHDIRGEGGRRP